MLAMKPFSPLVDVSAGGAEDVVVDGVSCRRRSSLMKDARARAFGSGNRGTSCLMLLVLKALDMSDGDTGVGRRSPMADCDPSSSRTASGHRRKGANNILRYTIDLHERTRDAEWSGSRLQLLSHCKAAQQQNIHRLKQSGKKKDQEGHSNPAPAPAIHSNIRLPS